MHPSSNGGFGRKSGPKKAKGEGKVKMKSVNGADAVVCVLLKPQSTLAVSTKIRDLLPVM